MIQNERQYQVTKEQLAQLESSLGKTRLQLAGQSAIPEVVAQAQLNSLEFLIADLKSEIAEYENLRDGNEKSLALDSVLQELPVTLIRARIMRGWTQKDLAQALGVSEQQVQKDEAGGYVRSSLEKLCRVAKALDVSLTGHATLNSPDGLSYPKEEKHPQAA